MATVPLTPRESFFPGDSEAARLMRSMDWSQSPLGEPETWPQSLRTTVRVLLTSRFAMWMGWGADLTFLYNDAYAAMTLGAKHPWALGRPSSVVWAEIWNELTPRVDRVLTEGAATWDEQLLLFLERNGYREETYHTFSYSPVIDDDGRIAGLLCVVSEETERVLGERRVALLGKTASAIAGAITQSDLFGAIEGALAGAPDLPFALLYLLDASGTRARLACRTGITSGHPVAPLELAVGDPDSPWPIDVHTPDTSAIVTMSDRYRDLAIAGPWDRPSTQALLVPIALQGQRRTAGFLVAGLNPFRAIDAAYRSFVDLLVGQIAAGLANAYAYEEERQRAESLAELDRAKTTFFSNVSHEFRTPLTLMLGPLDDVRHMDGLAPDVRDHLDVAHRNGRRLLKLVNTLLDFSRIEAGRVQARFEPVDLGALTADLASTFRSAMEKAGLAFSVACAPLAEPVYLDREMWEKIVLNLISNAFKFTLEGGVTVRVRGDGDAAVVDVIDTGTGIPPEELPRVFDRFHRVEGTAGRSHEGSGIGLALVQELVKIHGGELTATSEPGKGSTFTVRLKFGSAHLPAALVAGRSTNATGRVGASYVEEAMRWLPDAPSTADAVAGEESPDGILDTGRVLLADDNADMREYARRLLAERWTVDTAANGREALELARERHPDVIVTDVMMPELDGFGLLAAVRADPRLRTTPVVMLSARAGEEAHHEGIAASADDYLVKPFTARDLLTRVHAQIAKARARAAEERHARRMANLFAHAPVAIAVLRGPDHVFELANPKYAALIGGRDVVGLPIREALPELAGQHIYELLDGVRHSGEPTLGHSVSVTLNNGPSGEPQECYFDFVYQPLKNDAGEIEGIVVIAHDVTELARAKQNAEAANRLKDEFLATLSHELRTPLNAVLGYTQMLRGGAIAPERLTGVLSIIERNARLQEQLISDVLDVSRIVTGKLRLDIGPVDAKAIVEEALTTVAPAAAAKGVRIQVALDSPGVPVAGDGARLQQVAWNVLSNAIKFTPRGGRVQVRMQRVSSHVEIVVSDTGEGIAPEMLPYVFQRFWQADSSFTRVHGGLGLGLAISRHLVEAHGGRIEAISPGKGQGTTIRIALPVMIVHDSADAPDRAHPSCEMPPDDPLHLEDLTGLRVLLVDDDVDALAMARDVLSISGASVVTAVSPDDAVAMLERDSFDVAVIDIGMPVVDGYELLQRIRGLDGGRLAGLPVAALTAYARTADRARSLLAGFQMHLAKPVQPNELTAAVASLARRH